MGLCGYVELFDSTMSNYVIANYHTEVLQMIILLELANLNDSNYSLTFEGSYSILTSYVTDQFTNYPCYFGSPQTVFTN